MRFWTFWSFWGVSFVYFWASFLEDWFFLHLFRDFSEVWAAYPRLRWFFYMKWLVYLADLGLVFLYFPGFLRYLRYRQDNPTVDQDAKQQETDPKEEDDSGDIDSVNGDIIAF